MNWRVDERLIAKLAAQAEAIQRSGRAMAMTDMVVLDLVLDLRDAREFISTVVELDFEIKP